MTKIRDNFWAHVSAGPPDTCWEWMAGLDARGYGQLRGSTKTLKAHRVAYEKAVGPIPEGLLIRHSCHNPKCCNPGHLATGTSKDNHDDMVAAGRHFIPEPPRGEGHSSSKLTAQDVKIIRASCHKTLGELARQYNVTKQAICSIQKRRTWKHV